jgi:hypothetical protein
VNGIQCEFEFSAATGAGIATATYTVCSPAFTSSHDAPRPHVLVLRPGERVVSVAARTGALVDSLELRTSEGVRFRAGGAGGAEVRKVSLSVCLSVCLSD